MIFIIYFISFLMIATKLADVLSTIRFVGPKGEESNPLVKWIMSVMGLKRAMWFVFAFCLIMFMAITMLAVDGLLSPKSFIIFGIVISVMQGAVALTNRTGRENVITRMMFSYFSWHQKFFSLLFSTKRNDKE